MGIFGWFKKQFVDVLEYTESHDNVLSIRYPMADREIQNGASLTVRESQVALFVNEGEVADLFVPGTSQLNTRNLPVLSNLKNWDKLFQSPFKSDVYFLSTREIMDLKWGTPQPITVRDKEFGVLRIRAHGTYSFRLQAPHVFFKKVVGTRELLSATDLEGQLRSSILTHLATFLASSQIAFLDMAANQVQFSETLKAALSPLFTTYGLELCQFFVQSVSIPEELQGHLDKMASMRMVGDLNKYFHFQSAETLTQGGGNANGAALGAQMATGLAMGQTMAQQLSGGINAAGGGAAKDGDDAMATLNKLHYMMTKGILSKEEYEGKKAELLKRIT